LLLAQRFLDEVLIPAIGSGRRVSVTQMCHDFQAANDVPGNDFELTHVWVIASERSMHWDLAKSRLEEIVFPNGGAS
jgi:hypothetical protein